MVMSSQRSRKSGANIFSLGDSLRFGSSHRSVSRIPEDNVPSDRSQGGLNSSIQSDEHSSTSFHPSGFLRRKPRSSLIVKDIEPGEDDMEPSQKEAFAHIRPSFDCRPMEKGQRRNARILQYISDSVVALSREIRNSQWLTHQRRSDGLTHVDTSVTPVSTHGRQDVQPRLVPVKNPPTKNSSLNELGLEIGSASQEMGCGGITQFRLSNRKPTTTCSSRILALCGISGSSAVIYDDVTGTGDQCSCFGFEPNTCVTRYLHWSIRQSFMVVFLSAAVGYFVITLLFGLLILWSGYTDPQCLTVLGKPFSDQTTFFRDFGDAFALSWNTFSTTGYGAISPSTSVAHFGRQCGPILFLSSVEAFVGVIFGSFCGAIIFGKVSRVRSIAQIVFSDVMVIRYGLGAKDQSELTSDDESSKSANDSSSGMSTNLNQLPLPVLEFRLANRMHNVMGGEIMDCTLNIVASIDSSRADSLRQHGRRHRRRKGKRVPRQPNVNFFSGDSTKDLAVTETDKSSIQQLTDSLRRRALQPDPPFEEDAFGKITSKRIFVKLHVETQDHPFFRRTWTVRHVLDLESPILADDAKKAIRLNNGFWPKELNDAASVRACLNVDQILLSFSGTSNADANSVYAQKIYDAQSIKIGYVFLSMMYKTEESELGVMMVDLTAINDLEEQHGGGGESFEEVHGRDLTDLYVL